MTRDMAFITVSGRSLILRGMAEVHTFLNKNVLRYNVAQHKRLLYAALKVCTKMLQVT